MIEPNREIPFIGYTLEEAAAALRIHPQTLAKFLRKGEIRARKIGKGWLIHPNALEDWIKEGGAIEDEEQS